MEHIRERAQTWREAEERLGELRLAGFRATATDMGEHISIIITRRINGRPLAEIPPRRER